MSIWIIVNPKAGGGRAARAGEELCRLVSGAELRTTAGPGGARDLARKARSLGVHTVVAVGGDGTISEAVNGLVLDPPAGTAPPRLAVLPAGTGGDYRRTFGWDGSVERAARRIEAGNERAIDVGRVDLTNPGGATERHAFVNVMSFGIGGLTDRFVSRGPKWLGGRAAFFLGAVGATIAYAPCPVEIWADGELVDVLPIQNVAVCLGRYFGGGMQIAPAADPSDGLFDVVTIAGTTTQTLGLAVDVYLGKHLTRGHVKSFRARHFEARPTRPAEVLVDVDGEQPGRLPLRAEILPRALTLLT